MHARPAGDGAEAQTLAGIEVVGDIHARLDQPLRRTRHLFNSPLVATKNWPKLAGKIANTIFRPVGIAKMGRLRLGAEPSLACALVDLGLLVVELEGQMINALPERPPPEAR